MLTRKQNELLLFISQQISKDGVSPSFDEMKDALGLKSKSGVHRLVTALEERGFVRRFPNRARALEITRLPEAEAYEDRSRTVRSAFRGFRRRLDPADTIQNELPLYGRIAAGTPIEALRDPDSTVAVPQGMLGSGRHYALEIAGDSMVDAGIVDGDTVIIQECEEVESGAIVVALVDSEEATLKIWRPADGRVVLEAANDAYPAQDYDPDQVQIQGRLVGLLRAY
ncbi:MAG: transcriptional repressor LexA [Alphaproteobacteria bacterium]|nr:transcriptional repressor LexA [Alphaproteobacteria bacterium]